MGGQRAKAQGQADCPCIKTGCGRFGRRGERRRGNSRYRLPCCERNDRKNRERRPARPSAAAAGRNGMIRSDNKIGALVDIALKKDWPGLWPAGV